MTKCRIIINQTEKKKQHIKTILIQILSVCFGSQVTVRDGRTQNRQNIQEASNNIKAITNIGSESEKLLTEMKLMKMKKNPICQEKTVFTQEF